MALEPLSFMLTHAPARLLGYQFATLHAQNLSIAEKY